MKPNDRTLGDYFEGANPFVVPPYQRPYEWDEPRWVDLWRDLLLLYRRSLASSQRLELNGPQHFMGTLILRGIERQLSGRGAHAVPFGKGEELFSIEHVLPQAQDPGRAWRQDLDKWGEPVDLPSSQELRHTLGNLTAVTNYDNSVNGQKPFSVKRGLIAKTAPLRLHSSFKRRQKWTSQEIVERTQALAVAALAHWRGPRQR